MTDLKYQGPHATPEDDNDDDLVGEILSRRRALRALGIAAA